MQLETWRTAFPSLSHVVAAAVALGAERVEGWTKNERDLLRRLPQRPSRAVIEELRDRIRAEEDPLGDTLCTLLTPEQRRPRGATYTPSPIVSAMVRWAQNHGSPVRVIDPGAGSGRFLLAAARAFPSAELIAVELDPLASIITRANVAANGMQRRVQMLVRDYRDVSLPVTDGPTLFIGNPPYVRHHQIETAWKRWLSERSHRLGLQASQLAGLHVHFFLATLLLGRSGDYGCFITASEWLDVNYGRLVRDLFLGPLGGLQLAVVEPTALPFPDAATTAAVTCFEIGAQPKKIRVRQVKTTRALGRLSSGPLLRRERFEAEERWSHLTRRENKPPPGFVELGELCRVHRGQVTGSNKVWIEGAHSVGLPESVLFPTVTKARELYRANRNLIDPALLRRVIDLPVDLDELNHDERLAVNRFLQRARKMGAHESYIARNRRAWWAVGLRSPAPILATYMARRPPAFVINKAQARHINIAHGLYPREPLSERVCKALVQHLSEHTTLLSGRTYAGGLTKFEPREMERIFVPNPSLLGMTT